MKSCPTCNRTFEDTFTFCLVDGAVLSAPYDPEATKRIPEAYKNDPSTTEVLPGNAPLASSAPGSASQARLQDVVSESTKPSHEPAPKKPSTFKRIIRAMIKCGLIGILPGILVGVTSKLASISGWPGNSYQQFEAIGGGALGGFVLGAILLPLLWKFIKYVWRD